MNNFISASEIGEYLFCHRAWWLRRHGGETTNVERLEQGAIEHEKLVLAVAQVEQATHTGLWLLWLGAALLILLILVKLIAG
jgi:hypothetical protein